MPGKNKFEASKSEVAFWAGIIVGGVGMFFLIMLIVHLNGG